MPLSEFPGLARDSVARGHLFYKVVLSGKLEVLWLLQDFRMGGPFLDDVQDVFDHTWVHVVHRLLLWHAPYE